MASSNHSFLCSSQVSLYPDLSMLLVSILIILYSQFLILLYINTYHPAIMTELCLPKFTCQSPNPWCDSIFRQVIKAKEVIRVGPSQIRLVSILGETQESLLSSQEHRRGLMSTQGESGHLLARKTSHQKLTIMILDSQPPEL